MRAPTILRRSPDRARRVPCQNRERSSGSGQTGCESVVETVAVVDCVRRDGRGGRHGRGPRRAHPTAIASAMTVPGVERPDDGRIAPRERRRRPGRAPTRRARANRPPVRSRDSKRRREIASAISTTASAGRASRSPRRPATGAMAAPARASPTAQARGRPSPTRMSLGLPWPAPPSDHRELARAEPRTTGAAPRPATSGRPARRAGRATYHAGQQATDDGQPELEAAGRGIDDGDRVRGVVVDVEERRTPSRPPTTAPGTIPTTMNSRSSGRRARVAPSGHAGGDQGRRR